MGGVCVCLEARHRYCLGRPFSFRERDDLEMLFNFAARILRDLGEVIRLFGRMFVEDVGEGYWGTEFEHLLFDIVDQVTDMDVDDVMLRQTLPLTEGETPSQGAVGGKGPGDAPPTDVDEHCFSLPRPRL